MTTTSRSAMSGRAVDPSHLESLGKAAARLAETSDLSLTNAVVETVGREKLNSEQVRRVVEHANIEAFNRKYASTSGVMRAVHIDGGPADPIAVLQSLENGAAPREATIDSIDYGMPPSRGKAASYEVASLVDRTPAGVVGGIQALHTQLKSAHNEVVQNLEVSRGELNDSLVELGESVRLASLQGAAPLDFFEAWAATDAEVAKVAYQRVAPFMNVNNVKVANRGLNPRHPAVQHFQSFAKAAQSYARHHEALMLIEQELLKVSSWLKARRSA